MKYLKLTIYFIAFLGLVGLGYGQTYAFSASEVVKLTNSNRNQNGLGSLETNAKLTDAALAKANDMLNNDYFAHTAPSGKTPWDFILDAGYNYNFAGENLSIGYSDGPELLNAWMNSPSHRANILNENFHDIGIAIVYGDYDGAQTVVVVQMFGAINPGTVQAPVKVESVATTQTQIENDLNKPENAETAPPEVAVQLTEDHSQQFELIKDKTNLSTNTIFAGEKVIFKVTITGSIQNLFTEINGQTINLAEAAANEQNNGEKTFSKEVTFDTSGSFPVVLTASDKWGNTEKLELGTLTVNKKDIFNVQDKIIGNLGFLNNLKINPMYLISVLGLIILIIAGYLVFNFYRNKKLSRPLS